MVGKQDTCSRVATSSCATTQDIDLERTYDVVIVGGGIVGAALAYHLSRYRLTTLLVDSAAYFGTKTSLGNSGIIHGGFDANPKESKARFNIEGRRL